MYHAAQLVSELPRLTVSLLRCRYKDEEWASHYSSCGERDASPTDGSDADAVKRDADDGEAMEEEVRARLKKLMFDTRMSPLMMSDGELAHMPRTHLLVCRYDPLRDDGVSQFVLLRCFLSRNH